MVIKILLSKKKEWDVEIMKWLATVPAGYRSTEMKRRLYLSIVGEPLGAPTVAHNPPSVGGSQFDEKLRKLVGINEPCREKGK